MAETTKAAFLASMSHELRTPLNAIIGFSELIRDQAFGPGATARYSEYAKDVVSAGEHLLEIFNASLARLEGGQLESTGPLSNPESCESAADQ
jgi:signal transduction histidine kinase